jgi:hypothetical protein
MVGVGGFEPPTSRSRTERSTKLSHTPTRRRILPDADWSRYRERAPAPCPALRFSAASRSLSWLSITSAVSWTAAFSG